MKTQIHFSGLVYLLIRVILCCFENVYYISNTKTGEDVECGLFCVDKVLFPLLCTSLCNCMNYYVATSSPAHSSTDRAQPSVGVEGWNLWKKMQHWHKYVFLFFYCCQRLASRWAETPLFSEKRHIFSPVAPTALELGAAVSVHMCRCTCVSIYNEISCALRYRGPIVRWDEDNGWRSRVLK